MGAFERLMMDTYPFLRSLYEMTMRSFYEDDYEEDECYNQNQDDEVIDLQFDEKTQSYKMEV